MNVSLSMKKANAFKFQTSELYAQHSKSNTTTSKPRAVKVFSRAMKRKGFSSKDRMRERMIARRAAFLGHEKIPQHVVNNNNTSSSSFSLEDRSDVDSNATASREFNEALLNVPSFMFRRFNSSHVVDPIERHAIEFLDIVKAQNETRSRLSCVKSALDLYDRKSRGFVDPGSLTPREAIDLLDLARSIRITTFHLGTASIDAYIYGLEERLGYALIWRSKDDEGGGDEHLMMHMRGSIMILLRLSPCTSSDEVCCEWYALNRKHPTRELSSSKYLRVFWDCDSVDFDGVLL